MPRVKYTAAKGLFQEAGSGLDITGSLEITGAASVSGNLTGAKKEVKAASVALTLADSGCVLIPTGTAKTFTLPAVATAAGFHVTFQAGSAANHIINGGGSKMQGVIFNVGGLATLAKQAVSNRSTITTAGVVGDYITIVGDGTNYYVYGFVDAVVTLA